MEQDEKQVPKTKNYDWLKPTQFKPGQSGNPNGRPKGPTLKTWLKEHFETLTEEERAEFLNKVDPIKAWEMAEGKPQTQTDVTSNGETINFVVPNEIADKNKLHD